MGHDTSETGGTRATPRPGPGTSEHDVLRTAREWLAAGLEMADHVPEVPRFNAGVIQT